MAKSVGKQPDTVPLLDADGGQNAALLRSLKIVSWLGMILVTFYACTRMVAAGDTWVAMACGRHFIAQGVDTVEPFSANSHHAGPTLDEIKAWPTSAKLLVDVDASEIDLDLEETSWIQRALLPKFDLETIQYWHPTGWVNQNWLTHVIFYWLTTSLGSEEEPYFNALVYWKFALYLLAVVAIYFTGREIGLCPLAAAMSACFALYLGRSFLDVRPAGFSNLMVVLFVLSLVLATRRKILFIWLIVPLAVFWCNLHGGYIYVFIMLLPFIGIHTLVAIPRRWTPPVYMLLGWPVLAFLCAKLIGHPTLTGDIGPSSAIYTFVLLLSVGLLIARVMIKRGVHRLYATYVFSLIVVFFVLFVQLFPETPARLRPEAEEALLKHLMGARVKWIFLYFTFIGLGVLLSFHKEKLVRVSPKSLWHLFGAATAAFVATIVFNPFHLTNLTHTIEISVSEHAARWRQVHEWHAAFDWTNPVGTAVPFLIMCIIAAAAIGSWIVLQLMASSRPTPVAVKGKPRQVKARYEWPKMDLAILIVGFLTIVMAMQSRRFIPIAGFVACPLIMLLIQQGMEVIYGLAGRINHGIRQEEKSVGCPVTAWCTAFLVFLPLACYLAVALLSTVRAAGIDEGKAISEFHAFRTGFTWVYILGCFAVVLVGGWLVSGLRKDRSSPFDGPQGTLLASRLLLGTVVIVAIHVLCFAGWFAKEFKRIYLDPWPPDPHYSSVFMRMTASFYKPFKACKFMRENKLSGNMMNYWTEGGFIGWGQEADPESGKTPLQLFMDGRAQAAYDRKAFDQWHQIWGGGPESRRYQIETNQYRYLRERGETPKKPVPLDYAKMGAWISEELRMRDVWVALVPQGQFDRPFCRALERQKDWPIVFLNNKQKLFVDGTTEKGKALFNGIRAGKTVYPDEFTKALNLGRYYLIYDRGEGAKQKGLDYLIQAYELNPTPAPVIEVLTWAIRYAPLHTQVTSFCRKIVEDFENQEGVYIGQDGFRGRQEAARMSCNLLVRLATQSNNPTDATKFTALAKRISVDRDRQGVRTRW